MAEISLLKRFAITIFATVSAPGALFGQVTAEQSLLPGARAASTDSDVVLLIRTKDFKSTEDIQTDINVAAHEAGAKFDKSSFRIEAIDYATWRKFGSILGGFDIGMENEEIEFDKGKVRLTQTSYRNQFVLQVPPTPDLDSLNLEYRKPAPTPEDPGAMETKTLELKPGIREDDPEKMPLRRKSIGGLFNLTLPSDWVPISAQVKMKDEEGDGTRIEWPNQSLYLGRMNDFSGDLSRMFEEMGKKNVLGVPIQGLHQSRSLNVVMADFVRPFASIEVGWKSKDTYYVRIPYDPALPANRVWFLFPMSQSELSGAEKTMQSFPASEYQYAKKLRSSQNPYSAVFEDDKKMIASETSPPQWLILPLVDKGTQKFYEREIKVENADVWRKRYANEANALYLYEFDTVEGPKILPMAGDNKDKTRMYTTQEIMRWDRGLPNAR